MHETEERERRRLNVVFYGLTIVADPRKMVSECLSKLGLSGDDQPNVVRSWQLAPHDKQHKPLLFARFCSIEDRNRVLVAARKRRSNQIEQDGFYVNEDLTQFQRQQLWQLREEVKRRNEGAGERKYRVTGWRIVEMKSPMFTRKHRPAPIPEEEDETA